MFTVTFYSYKGGVGRTLALANTAYTLATDGEDTRVAIVDFDLEAPGLDAIPPFESRKLPEKGGVVEYITSYAKSENGDPENLPSIKPYSYQVAEIPNVTVIPAGKKDRYYQECLTRMNWEWLYKHRQGYRFFEQLKKKIKEELSPDYLLVDSRTGLADVSGITTHQLADLVVLVFNLNRQNLDGIRTAYDSIISTQKIPSVKILLVASPVPREQMPDDSLLRSRLKKAAESMPHAINSAPDDLDGIIQVPYHPLLALDDLIFVRDHPDREISKAYRKIAEHVLMSNPSEMRSLLEKAFRYRDENMFEEAEEVLQCIIAQRPSSARGRYYYGDYLLKLGRWQDAERQLTEACRLASTNPTYLSALGSALSKLGRDEAALEQYKKAEELAPRNESILQQIANLYYKLNDAKGYLEYLQKLNQVKLPATRLDTIRPAQQLDQLFIAFMEADLGFPADFDRMAFWDAVKAAIALGYREKLDIVRGILEKKITYFQIEKLGDILAEEESKFRKMLGEEFAFVRDRIRLGELDLVGGTCVEEQIGHLVRTGQEDRASAIRLVWAGVLIGMDREAEAVGVIERGAPAVAGGPLAAQLYKSWGDALIKLSKEPERESKASLLREACEKYRMATSIKADIHEAFYNWGSALRDLSVLATGDDRASLLREACEKYRMATSTKADKHEAFNNWGGALRDLSVLATGDDRASLLREACEKYRMATSIKADKHEAFNNWGNALSNLSVIATGDDRASLLREACEKYRMATSIKADKHEAFNNWGNALSNLSVLATGDDRASLLREACEKYLMATSIKPDIHEAFNNWGSALIHLSYLIPDGKDRNAILREALAKAEEAQALVPGAGAYNAACACSLLGRKKKALSLLKDAIKRDPSCRALAAKDEDFTALRDDKSFQLLVSDCSSGGQNRDGVPR